MLNAHHIKVGDFLQEKATMPQLVDAFGGLCRDASGYGTRIGFELMPFAMIRMLDECLAMVKGADAANGGIIFDLWHVVKLGIPYDKISLVPLEFIVSIELIDGTFTAPWSLHEDTVNHRRLCGEGEFDVRGFIATVQKTGYKGPWGIEVLSAELRALPLDELTSRAFRTTMAQFG